MLGCLILCDRSGALMMLEQCFDDIEIDTICLVIRPQRGHTMHNRRSGPAGVRYPHDYDPKGVAQQE